MCFWDVCFNAKNFTKSKQPAVVIHLLRMILDSSPPPISAWGKETSAKKKKTWVLQVISKSWDSSHTFWGKNHPLILSFVGLHVPPSFEAGVNFCLEAGTSLLKPTQCLILTSHHIHQNQHVPILVSAQYYSWTRSCGRVSPLSYFEWCLLNQTLIISFSAKAHSHKHLIIHQARKDLS